jgi:HEPN domain-containing protein
MSDNYLDWLHYAEENIDVVKLLFDNKKYRFAVFNLQQAGEITSKALLMKTSLLTTVEENEIVKDIRKNFDLPAMSAIDWGHDWHRKLVKVTDKFIDKLDELSEFILINRIQERKATANIIEFRASKPDYKEKIEKAKTTKLELNPSSNELNAVLFYCHQRLYIASKVARTLQPKLAKLEKPKKERLIKQTEKALGIEINQETSKAIDKVLAINTLEYAQNMTIFSQTLTILAIVNSYLLPHESRSRYPFGQTILEYSDNTPLVRQIPEFSRIIKLAMRIGENKHDVYRYNKDIENNLKFKKIK